MSQNRQSGIDRDKAKQDLDINVKAEMEIESLHQKIDSLRDKEIAELSRMISIQNQTIHRLEEMLSREISSNHPDPWCMKLCQNINSYLQQLFLQAKWQCLQFQ